MTKKQKKMLYRIIAALALVLVLKLLPPLPASVELLLYCIPYLVVGWDVLRKALLGIKNRQLEASAIRSAGRSPQPLSLPPRWWRTRTMASPSPTNSLQLRAHAVT